MTKDVAAAIRETLISPNLSDANLEAANLVDAVGLGLRQIAISGEKIALAIEHLAHATDLLGRSVENGAKDIAARS